MTGSPAAVTETDRIFRECDCPPWVIRCAHLPSGELLILAAPSGPCKSSLRAPLPVNGKFSVATIDPYEGCDDGCGLLLAYPEYVYVRGVSLDAALAAFYEAEEALLRGES